MKTHYPKVRIGVVFMLFLLAFVLFSTRLFFVQVVRGEELRNKAKRQYQESIIIPAERGEILDVKGNKVVVNSTSKSLFAYPVSKKDVAAAYRQLSRILKKSQGELKQKYKLRPKRFCWIRRRLTDEELTAFEKYGRQCGLYLKEEPTRAYPYGHIGRSVLGFVDLDNCGKSGVELVMDDILAGTSGRSLLQKDGKGTEYSIRDIPLKQSAPGLSIVLTIDWDKQQIVEEELARAVEKYNARGGMAVFLDPFSGAIIAAADYNPEQKPSDKPMKLEAVGSTFEPGSVFKLVVAAAALDDGRINPSDTFYAEGGRWKLGRHTLRDDHEYEWLTFRKAFESSSNIVMGKIAGRITGDKVLAMARRLGFGQKTRCGLNGESRGILKPPRWSRFTTSTFAIGHGLSVTTIQMAQAYAVIASGGYLNRPYLVKGCINQQGKIIDKHRKRSVKVLDDELVATLDSFLRGVVDSGTGQPLLPVPFPIAGKTGTAEKPNLETGGYHKNRFMASFAGYFPADSPVVAGIVLLDEPEPIHYGGYTAGPAFKNIAIRFGAIDGYRYSAPDDFQKKSDCNARRNDLRKDDSKSERVILSDLAGVARNKAKRRLEQLGLCTIFSGSGDQVLSTQPAAHAGLHKGDTVRCLMNKKQGDNFEIPDLHGMTMREAIAILQQYQVPFVVEGKGRVERQLPKAGSVMTRDNRVQLFFKRNKGV